MLKRTVRGITTETAENPKDLERLKKRFPDANLYASGQIHVSYPAEEPKWALKTE